MNAEKIRLQPSQVAELRAYIHASTVAGDKAMPFTLVEVSALLTERESLLEENQKLKDEVEALRADAERYRWLLDNCGFGIRKNQVTELSVMLLSLPNNINDLSAAIDAARHEPTKSPQDLKDA